MTYARQNKIFDWVVVQNHQTNDLTFLEKILRIIIAKFWIVWSMQMLKNIWNWCEMFNEISHVQLMLLFQSFNSNKREVHNHLPYLSCRFSSQIFVSFASFVVTLTIFSVIVCLFWALPPALLCEYLIV